MYNKLSILTCSEYHSKKLQIETWVTIGPTPAIPVSPWSCLIVEALWQKGREGSQGQEEEGGADPEGVLPQGPVQDHGGGARAFQGRRAYVKAGWGVCFPKLRKKLENSSRLLYSGSKFLYSSHGLVYEGRSFKVLFRIILWRKLVFEHLSQISLCRKRVFVMLSRIQLCRKRVFV